MRNVHLPARVAEEHSETAYMTREAMRFIEDMGERPWFLHLSYVKPHWPYMAPAPYHALYGAEDCLPINRDPSELIDQHPVLAAYRRHEESLAFQRPEAPGVVRPAYMGLINQIDDWLGRLFDQLKKLGRFDDTLIFFTADHGDFLGDHWLGEKEMFYEEALRVPFIVYDPDPPADAARGTVDQRFVEGRRRRADLPRRARPAGAATTWSKAARCCRCCAAGRSEPGATLCSPSSTIPSARRASSCGRKPQDCRAMMVRTDRWKYVWWQDFRPMLFDLANDPRELRDLGAERVLRPRPPRDGRPPRRLAQGAQDAGHGRRRLCRGPHRHPQEARHILRRLVGAGVGRMATVQMFAVPNTLYRYRSLVNLERELRHSRTTRSIAASIRS